MSKRYEAVGDLSEVGGRRTTDKVKFEPWTRPDPKYQMTATCSAYGKIWMDGCTDRQCVCNSPATLIIWASTLIFRTLISSLRAGVILLTFLILSRVSFTCLLIVSYSFRCIAMAVAKRALYALPSHDKVVKSNSLLPYPWPCPRPWVEDSEGRGRRHSNIVRMCDQYSTVAYECRRRRKCTH